MSFALDYHSLEYHSHVAYPVQRSIPALLALFGVFLLPLLFVTSSPAQINSASSSGSGHSFSAAPPTGSVAPPTGSVAPPTGAASGHNAFGQSTSGVTHSGNFPHFPGGSNNTGEHHHPHRTANGDSYSPNIYPYWYAVPYAVDPNDASSSSNDNDNDDDDPEYQGGPTVFDRRGAGAASYVPPSYEGPAHAHSGTENASAAQSSDPAPESLQPPTTLVFKDGHQVEVENYAIVAQTLYDLSPGHPRKIALADLDLPATEKQNDDRGVTFQLPPAAQEN
jgi:hypothetical protein